MFLVCDHSHLTPEKYLLPILRWKLFCFFSFLFYFLKQHWRSLSLPSQTLWPSSEKFRWGAGETAKQWRALVVFQRTIVQIPSPTWQLTAICISSPRVSCFLKWCTSTHLGKTPIHFFFLKELNKKSPGTSRVQSTRQAGLLTEQGRVFTVAQETTVYMWILDWLYVTL